MAVVQISRIQVRRGQKNQGSGIPQLASGELGWAVDTRELYIGNGSVAEGAPAVGNTKVLTQYDNLFALADSYSYRAEDNYILTGSTTTSPTKRSLQDRLDDIVSGRSFGLTGETTQTCTVQLQRAIDQLYINNSTKGNVTSRVVLHLEAGTYVVNDTIYLPPYTTIVGAGSDKTIVKTSTANKPVFKTVNDTSTPGSPADDSSSTFNNQAKFINLKGMTIQSTVSNKGIVLQSCRDSHFEDIKVLGTWESSDSISTSDVGLEMNSLSGAVETKNNTFIDCTFKGWSYGVNSNWDIHDNHFDRCTFDELGFGVVFGNDIILDSNDGSGKETGPYQNSITNGLFNDIHSNGILVEEGLKNISDSNKFIAVGNSGGTEGQPTHAVIKFDKFGNTSDNDYFSRTESLGYDQSYINTVAYLPEVEGSGFNTQLFQNKVVLNQGDQKAFRLAGNSSQQIVVHYVAVSNNYTALWSGTLTITQNGYDNTATIEDEFVYKGLSTYELALKWTVTVTDENSDLTNETINVYCNSNMPSDDSTQVEFRIENKKSLIGS